MNTIDSSSADEPRLSPDFAARVIEQAEAIIGRRRRMQRAIAGGAVVAAISVVTVAAIWRSEPSQAPKLAPTPEYFADSRPAWIVVPSHAERGDAMGYFFPDAAPTAQLMGEYMASSYGISARSAAAAWDGTPASAEQQLAGSLTEGAP
jgi:hypothetical protein